MRVGFLAVLAAIAVGLLAVAVFAVGNKTEAKPANACATEAETFVAAVNAYKAQYGHPPTGNDGLDIARTLASGRQPMLNSAKLTYYDSANPPNAKRWTWDTTTTSPSSGITATTRANGC